MTVHVDGKPLKRDYRRFRIKDLNNPDDYASMHEVLSRRFLRGLREQETLEEISGFSQFPDLILMDGGKGQVHVAEQVLDALGIDIPVCGMVKELQNWSSWTVKL